MQISRLNQIRAIASNAGKLASQTAAAPLADNSAAIIKTAHEIPALPFNAQAKAIEEFVTTYKDKLSVWVKKLAPSVGLATKEDVVFAKLPVRNMLLHQVKNAQTSIYNSSLQCVGAGLGFSAAKWGADIVNYLFHTSVSLSPEFSLIARTVPISVFFNSLFRILENRRTLQVAQNNLAFLK